MQGLDPVDTCLAYGPEWEWEDYPRQSVKRLTDLVTK
jgi:hypothetical protein